MSAHEPEVDDERPDEEEGRVLSVHLGPSANCSSIGSFVDFLFVSSVVGGAVLSAVAALLRESDAEGDGDSDADADPDPEPDPDPEERSREGSS